MRPAEYLSKGNELKFFMALGTLKSPLSRVIVGIADMAVSNNVGVRLATYSLGSCLGISIYDPVVKVGGLIHVMLPDSRIDPSKGELQPAMFCNTGVPTMLEAARHIHAARSRLQVCVAGGAQVMDDTGYFSIGKRNYEMLSRVLNDYDLSIHAQEVGGLVSRSMMIDIATGEVRLKASGQSEEELLCNG